VFSFLLCASLFNKGSSLDLNYRDLLFLTSGASGWEYPRTTPVSSLLCLVLLLSITVTCEEEKAEGGG
jgi:hypothetical protein